MESTGRFLMRHWPEKRAGMLCGRPSSHFEEGAATEGRPYRFETRGPQSCRQSLLRQQREAYVRSLLDRQALNFASLHIELHGVRRRDIAGVLQIVDARAARGHPERFEDAVSNEIIPSLSRDARDDLTGSQIHDVLIAEPRAKAPCRFQVTNALDYLVAAV